MMTILFVGSPNEHHVDNHGHNDRRGHEDDETGTNRAIVSGASREPGGPASVENQDRDSMGPASGPSQAPRLW
jgi:hypothetical protein